MSMSKKEAPNSPSDQDGNISPLLPREETQIHMNPLVVKYKTPTESVNGMRDDCKEENREVAVDEDEDETSSGGYGWFVVLGCALAHVILGGFDRADGILYLKMIDTFHGSAQATAWVLSLSSMLLLLLAPLSSAISNKFSARISVFTGGIIFALGIFLSGIAPNLTFLYFTYGLISGTGKSLAYTPGLFTVGQYFKKKRGLAIGLSTAGTGVGLFMFPPLLEYIFQEFNYFGAFLILSAIPLNLCVVGALYRPLRLHRRIFQIQRKRTEKQSGAYSRQSEEESHLTKMAYVEIVSDAVKKENQELEDRAEVSEDESEIVKVQRGTLEPGTEDVRSPHNMSKSVPEGERTLSDDIAQNASSDPCSYTQGKRESRFWRLSMKILKRKHEQQTDFSNKDQKPKILEVQLLKDPAFVLFGISLCLFMACFKAGFTFLSAMAKSNGCTGTQAALLLSVAGVSDTVCRIGSGIVLDLKKVRRFRLMIYNGIPFATSVVLFFCPMMSSFPGFAIMAALFGSLTGSFISQQTVVLIDTQGRDKLSSSLGLLICIQGLGLLIGPPLSGALKDAYGNYKESFYFSGGGLLLTGLIMAVSNVIRVVQQRHSRTNSDGDRKSQYV